MSTSSWRNRRANNGRRSSTLRSRCHIPLPGESDNVWWLGFDCGHYMDVQPGREAFRKKLGFPALGMTFPDVMQPTYKTEGYVRSLTAELAASLKKVHS